MPIEVRAVEPAGEDEAPIIGRFTDDEWRNLTALAHECGFDAGSEYKRLVYPTESDTKELGTSLAQQLYIGVSAILNQDVLPFATTWESDDGYIHFRWVKTPEYGGDYAPANPSETDEGSEFMLKGATLESLMEHLLREPISIRRVAQED